MDKPIIAQIRKWMDFFEEYQFRDEYEGGGTTPIEEAQSGGSCSTWMK
jgi:hypothetical protein